ncbi:MAG TPA: hypothetical protein VFX30_09545 [bacterium]|nr:hypothetical protein [bacterium]
MKPVLLLTLSTLAGLFAAETTFGQAPLRRSEIQRDNSVLLAAPAEDCAIKLETEETRNPNLIKLKWSAPCSDVKEAYLYGPFYLSSVEEPEKQDLLFKEDGTTGDKDPDTGEVCDAAKCRDFDLEEFAGATRVMKIDLPEIAAEPSGKAFSKVYLPRNEFVLAVRYGQDVWKTAKVAVERPELTPELSKEERVTVLDPAVKTPSVTKSLEAARDRAAATVIDPIDVKKFLSSISLNDSQKVCDNFPENGASFTNCRGTLTLTATVSNPPANVTTVQFYSKDLGGSLHLIGTKPIVSGAAVLNNVPRNHTSYEWIAKAGSLTSPHVYQPYVPTFTMSDLKHSGCWADEYDDCCGGWDCDEECGVCAETEGAHMGGSIQWNGKHIKSVTSSCGQMVIEAPDANAYGNQSGKAEATWNTGDSFTTKTCDFTATAYDGTVLHWNNATWACTCN